MSRDLSVHQEHELLSALERAGLDKSLAQVVINSKDNESAKKVLAFMKNGFQPATELPFADEEVESDFQYPADFQFLSPVEQLLFWRERFPDLDGNSVEKLASVTLEVGAESIAVMPKPAKLGGYRAALLKVLGFIAASRSFKNWREGQLGPEYFRPALKTAGAIMRMEEYQPGDYLVFPYQFGMGHRGRSVRRGRVLYTEPEFGLGPYEGGCQILTHPKRITGDNQLYFDCGGAEYSPGAGGKFYRSLCFLWYDGRLSFGDGWSDGANQRYGSASGFLLVS